MATSLSSGDPSQIEVRACEGGGGGEGRDVMD